MLLRGSRIYRREDQVSRLKTNSKKTGKWDYRSFRKKLSIKSKTPVRKRYKRKQRKFSRLNLKTVVI